MKALKPIKDAVELGYSPTAQELRSAVAAVVALRGVRAEGYEIREAVKELRAVDWTAPKVKSRLSKLLLDSLNDNAVS